MQSKGSTKTLDSAVRDFILDRQIGGCTTASIEAYQSQLEPLIKWATDRELALASLTEEHLRQFLLLRGEVGKATLHSATVRLKTFFKWCAERDICNDLAASLRKPRQAHTVIRALSVNELQAMLSLCRGNSFVSRRDEALIRFLVDTAARVSEALDLTIERLDVNSGRALLNGKGDKQRYVFFGAKTARALTRYFATCESHRFRSNAVAPFTGSPTELIRRWLWAHPSTQAAISKTVSAHAPVASRRSLVATVGSGRSCRPDLMRP